MPSYSTLYFIIQHSTSTIALLQTAMDDVELKAVDRTLNAGSDKENCSPGKTRCLNSFLFSRQSC